MTNFKKYYLGSLLLISLSLSACASITASPESAATLSYWRIARGYQAEGRPELAKQYFTIALATARSSAAQQELQIEIDAANRVLQAMR